MIKTAKKYLNVGPRMPKHTAAAEMFNYIVETFTNDNFSQLYEMVRIMRKNGEIEDFKTLIKQDDTISDKDKIDLLIAMVG